MKAMIAGCVVALMCSGLTGCATTGSWSIEGTCDTSRKCSVGGKVGGTWGGGEKKSIYQGMMLALAANLPDAALFEIDVSGSSIGFPSSGLVTMTLVDTTTNVTIAAQQFPWTKVGGALKLSDPDAVNSWAVEKGGTADEMRYTLARFNASAPAGDNVISGTSKYQGVATASFTSRFSACQTKVNSPLLCADR